jgi:hypothetical protein
MYGLASRLVEADSCPTHTKRNRGSKNARNSAPKRLARISTPEPEDTPVNTAWRVAALSCCCLWMPSYLLRIPRTGAAGQADQTARTKGPAEAVHVAAFLGAVTCVVTGFCRVRYRALLNLSVANKGRIVSSIMPWLKYARRLSPVSAFASAAIAMP